MHETKVEHYFVAASGVILYKILAKGTIRNIKSKERLKKVTTMKMCADLFFYTYLYKVVVQILKKNLRRITFIQTSL